MFSSSRFQIKIIQDIFFIVFIGEWSFSILIAGEGSTGSHATFSTGALWVADLVLSQLRQLRGVATRTCSCRLRLDRGAWGHGTARAFQMTTARQWSAYRDLPIVHQHVI